MLHIASILLLLTHGFIHTLGFTKEFDLFNGGSLDIKPSFAFVKRHKKVSAILWLLAGQLFFLGSFGIILLLSWWWIPVALALIFSQTLIILYWHDAKYGTWINVLVFFMVLLSWGSWNFHRASENDVSKLFSKPLTKEKTYQPLDSMPSPVKKWLTRSGVLNNKKTIASVYLTQTGNMRTAPDAEWMTMDAEQYFNTVYPGFVWIANVAPNSYMPLSGRDTYLNGKGHMRIEVLSLIPIVNAEGKEIDQGTMLRYMGEMVWFPSEALSSYFQWEEIDSTSAKVTMNYQDVSASGIFHFSPEGDFKCFEAKRYYQRKEKVTLENWEVCAEPDGYRVFEGVRAPYKLSVSWKLEEGAFKWFTLEIKNIHYTIEERGE